MQAISHDDEIDLRTLVLILRQQFKLWVTA